MKESNHDMFFGSWYNLQDGSGIYAIVNSLDNKKYIGSTKGHPLSESQRNSIIKANKNRIWTEEMKRKKGLSAKNSNYIKSLQKIVQKYSLDGNLIEEYPSVMDAARAVGNPKISRVGIKRCYQGRQKSAYGYIWKLKIQEND